MKVAVCICFLALVATATSSIISDLIPRPGKLPFNIPGINQGSNQDSSTENSNDSSSPSNSDESGSSSDNNNNSNSNQLNLVQQLLHTLEQWNSRQCNSASSTPSPSPSTTPQPSSSAAPSSNSGTSSQDSTGTSTESSTGDASSTQASSPDASSPQASSSQASRTEGSNVQASSTQSASRTTRGPSSSNSNSSPSSSSPSHPPSSTLTFSSSFKPGSSPTFSTSGSISSSNPASNGLNTKIPFASSTLADPSADSSIATGSPTPADLPATGKALQKRDILSDMANIGQLVTHNGLNNLLCALSKIDFSKVREEPNVPALPPIPMLDVTGIKQGLLDARKRLVHALANGATDVHDAILRGVRNALRGGHAVADLARLGANIVRSYLQAALSADIKVKLALLQEGFHVAGSVFKSVTGIKHVSMRLNIKT